MNRANEMKLIEILIKLVDDIYLCHPENKREFLAVLMELQRKLSIDPE